MLELTRHDECQAFPAGLVDDGEDPELAPIMRPALDKVVPLRSHSNDAAHRRTLGCSAHTCPGYSGLSRMQDPSPSQSRPRFGWRLGTFNPSLRQIRSTRLRFTVQPASRSNAVTRR
jgi:hypothetical protein